ncbi:MAG: hypothetical protein IJB24_02275, partial [Clostridia bacterium]|nr:hypothetical protein [Clostridia bacterium]
MSEQIRRKPNTNTPKPKAKKGNPPAAKAQTKKPAITAQRRPAPRKKNDGFNKVLVRTVIVAAVAVLVVILGLMLSGLRYAKATDNAGTTAKFFGWVDDAGNIDKGTLY